MDKQKSGGEKEPGELESSSDKASSPSSLSSYEGKGGDVTTRTLIKAAKSLRRSGRVTRVPGGSSNQSPKLTKPDDKKSTAGEEKKDFLQKLFDPDVPGPSRQAHKLEETETGIKPYDEDNLSPSLLVTLDFNEMARMYRENSPEYFEDIASPDYFGDLNTDPIDPTDKSKDETQRSPDGTSGNDGDTFKNGGEPSESDKGASQSDKGPSRSSDRGSSETNRRPARSGKRFEKISCQVQ